MEFMDYARFALALVFVLGLIGIFALLGRRAGLGFPTAALNPKSQRRLGIVEVTPLDGRRRLGLVRRDDTEHLLVLTPNSEMVIERGITDGPARTGSTPSGNVPEPSRPRTDNEASA